MFVPLVSGHYSSAVNSDSGVKVYLTLASAIGPLVGHLAFPGLGFFISKKGILPTLWEPYSQVR